MATIISMFLTVCIAYPLTKTRLKGRHAIFFLVLITMYFSGGIIPDFILVKSLNLLDTVWALLLPSAISTFNVIILKTFFTDSVPKSVEDAAAIDGCNDLVVLLRIVLPLSKPVLASISLFYAVGYWNDYFNCMLYINDTAKQTAQLILRSIVLLASGFDLSGSPIDFGPMGAPPEQAVKLASTIVTIVPILVVYPFVQKFFTKGIMIGAVKG